MLQKRKRDHTWRYCAWMVKEQSLSGALFLGKAWRVGLCRARGSTDYLYKVMQGLESQNYIHAAVGFQSGGNGTAWNLARSFHYPNIISGLSTQNKLTAQELGVWAPTWAVTAVVLPFSICKGTVFPQHRYTHRHAQKSCYLPLPQLYLAVRSISTSWSVSGFVKLSL